MLIILLICLSVGLFWVGLKIRIAKLNNPTIEKIGMLYNALGKEKISSYDKILKYYYDNESWIQAYKIC